MKKKQLNKQCLLDITPTHSKKKWKTSVLASDSSKQQTLVLKTRVQMILKAS